MFTRCVPICFGSICYYLLVCSSRVIKVCATENRPSCTQKCTFTACCTFLAHSIKNLGIKKCWLFSSPLLIRRKPRERRDRRRDLGHPSRNSHGRSVSRFLFATVFFDRGEKLFPTSPHPGKKTGAFSSCPSKLTLSASAPFYLKCISKIFSPPFPRLPLPFKAFPLPSQTRKSFFLLGKCTSSLLLSLAATDNFPGNFFGENSSHLFFPPSDFSRLWRMVQERRRKRRVHQGIDEGIKGENFIK